MRNIKFRAWDKEEKKMARVFMMDLGAEEVTLDDYAVDKAGYRTIGDEVELMQYTGLKANGVEIYEGDILEDEPVGLGLGNRAVVVWNDGGFLKKTLGSSYDGLLTPLEPRLITLSSTKVIGNIWEDKELLK